MPVGNGENLPQIEALNPAFVPQKKAEQVAPKLLDNPMTAVLAFDSASGKVLLDRNSSRPQEIASLSKLMMALIILENHKLDEVVTVPIEATKIDSSTIGLYQHEKISVRTLLEASLIPSANDAAVALAVYHSGSEEEFVKVMNKKAKELELDSAKFFNATGLDIFSSVEGNSEKEKSPLPREIPQSGTISRGEPPFRKGGGDGVHGNLMSANDVLRLMRILLQYDFFRETIGKDKFYGTSVDEEFSHEKPSTNQLLGTFLNITGGKTGFTYLAGECFVAIGNTPEGHEVITVILGSSDRFGETKTLLSWIYDSFEWR